MVQIKYLISVDKFNEFNVDIILIAQDALKN